MSKSLAQVKANSNFNATWLKKFKGFENYSDKQAEETVKVLQELAAIACRHIQNTS
ncbi:hypothetical protein [Aquimarina agarilytica]|uniref:hypothetical protein n=1 Tax=Aquimarina agarilytica TaxID=1087449 RepID=UPI00030EE44B|nr:hypothetical protein [Aquimarina agarilytica]